MAVTQYFRYRESGKIYRAEPATKCGGLRESLQDYIVYWGVLDKTGPFVRTQLDFYQKFIPLEIEESRHLEKNPAVPNITEDTQGGNGT